MPIFAPKRFEPAPGQGLGVKRSPFAITFSVYFDIQLLNELLQMKHSESEQQQQQQQHEVVLNAVLSITSNAAAFFMVRSHLVFSFGFTVESQNDVLSVWFCLFVCCTSFAGC